MLGQAAAGDGEKTKNLRFLAGELREFAAGMRALESGDEAGAEAASTRMDAGLWRVEQAGKASGVAAAPAGVAGKDAGPMVPVMPDATEGPLVSSLSVASLELRAGVLAGKGKVAEAKALYAEAAKAEKALGYHEPPLYVRPVGETEAAALLRAGDYTGARAAYEAALVERPDSGFGLYGLARVKEMQGDGAGARVEYAAFLKGWAAADAGLPEVIHARAVVGGAVVAGR